MARSDTDPADVTLRPFSRDDFGRLISWLPSEAAHIEWCGAFFGFPLDDAQLERYLESSTRPNGRVVFSAERPTGEVVGHVEISHVWPRLSSRLSRVLVAPTCRRRGIGSAMVAQALAFSFRDHGVARIDVGVSQDNGAAISCYRKLGFEHVGTWIDAMTVGGRTIDVYWMTVTKDRWAMAGAPSK